MKTTKKPAPKKTASRTVPVKAKSDASSDLQELFEEGLKDLYWAEKALVKSLPKMAKNCTDEGLKAAIKSHIEMTQTHVTRLEEVFASINIKAVAKKCDAMEGLIEEGNSILEDTEAGVVRDAGIIAAAQKIEHYEIASYGTLRAFAEVMGLSQAEQLLAETLQEEKDSDQMLTELAVSAINMEAMDAE